MINQTWYHGASESNISHFTQPINWFTTDYDYASEFGSVIYSCTIEPKRIFHIGNTDERIFELFPVKPYRFTKEFLSIIKGFDEAEVRRILLQLASEFDYGYDGYKMPIFTFIRSKYFAQKLKELGYDAVSTIEEWHECLGVIDQTIITINKVIKITHEALNLKEEYLDDDKLVFVTDSPYQVKNIITDGNNYFIAYDKKLKKYFVGKLHNHDVTHINMILMASKNGYYQKEFTYTEAMEYALKNVQCFRSGPLTTNIGLGAEGYINNYIYDSVQVAFRDMSYYGGNRDDYKNTELARVLGDWKEHRYARYTDDIYGTPVKDSLYEDLKDDAKAYFGTTFSPQLAFYLNTDGTLLDGSGKALGSSGGSRAVDHREISDIFTGGISGDDAMLAYMREGNIRLKPEAPGFEIMKYPTDAQCTTLRKIISYYFGQEYYIDLCDTNGTIVYNLYYEQVSPSAIEDVKAVFNGTYIPGGNNDEHYRYRPLFEDTRTVLINKSRNQGDYKDKTHGKNRFERKKFSKVANAVKEYNQLDMNDFFKRDILTVKVPVQGETDSYTVSIKMEGVCAEIAKNVKSNKNKFEFRTVIQALTKIFNTGNVYVNCTCPDHRYNFSHWNIINNVSTEDTAHDPGPGKNIRNPKDDKGRGCKHVLLVLNNGDWMMKVASVINNYVHYAEEHMQKPFLKLIFPKIYGIPADEMVEQDLIDDEKFLDSSKGLIDAINAYGAKRGQYKPGTNKNPVTGTGGRTKKEEEKPVEEKEESK